MLVGAHVSATHNRSLRLTYCRDEDGLLTKADVLSGIGPLMHAAQGGMVLLEHQSPTTRQRQLSGAWDEFREGMRELAVDKVASVIAEGAYEEVDADGSGVITSKAACQMPACSAG